MALLGLLLVVSALGFLLYEAFWGDPSPPDVVVELDQIVDSGADYLVTFTAHNRGGETAAGVTVTGTLSYADNQTEHARVTLD